jgi:hypothetical protein
MPVAFNFIFVSRLPSVVSFLCWLTEMIELRTRSLNEYMFNDELMHRITRRHSYGGIRLYYINIMISNLLGAQRKFHLVGFIFKCLSMHGRL